MNRVARETGNAVLVLGALATCGCGGRVHDADAKPVDRVLPSNGGASSSLSGVGGNATSSGSSSSRPASNAIADAGDTAVALDAGRDGAFTLDAGHDPMVGVWVGQVEHSVTAFANQYPDAPPQHVVLVVADAGGALVGSIVFGDAPPPPKATDPDAFYPPVTPAGTGEDQEIELADLLTSPYVGQPYSLLNLRRTDTRLTFQFAPTELWKDWCALQQKTYFAFDGSEMRWSCVPDGTSKQSPEVGKASLCLRAGTYACICDENGCQFSVGVYEWDVDLQINGGTLQGQAFAALSRSGIWANGVKLRRVSQ